MRSYERPTLTDLGTVEDLTQLTISIKFAQQGADIHFNKTGHQTVTGGKAGLTISGGKSGNGPI